MFLSYLKNFFYIFFFNINILLLFFKHLFFFAVCFSVNFKKRFLFNLNIFKLLYSYKYKLLFIFIFIKNFVLNLLFLNYLFLAILLFKSGLIIFSNYCYLSFKQIIFTFLLIKLFLYKFKLKIYDRVAYVPKFLTFGRGDIFKKRFVLVDFNFVAHIFYWFKFTFNSRYQIFNKFKSFISKKHYAGFRLVFKLIFFFIKLPFFSIKFIFLYFFNYCFFIFFWIFLSDICFVL